MAVDIHIGEVQNRLEKIWLREDGIIQIVVLPGAEYILGDVRKGLASIVKLGKGKRRPVLADIRNIKTIEREARIELSKVEGVTSVAFLIDSALSRIIGNIIRNFGKQAVPSRLFTSEVEAVAWLKEYLE